MLCLHPRRTSVPLPEPPQFCRLRRSLSNPLPTPAQSCPPPKLVLARMRPHGANEKEVARPLVSHPLPGSPLSRGAPARCKHLRARPYAHHADGRPPNGANQWNALPPLISLRPCLASVPPRLSRPTPVRCKRLHARPHARHMTACPPSDANECEGSRATAADFAPFGLCTAATFAATPVRCKRLHARLHARHMTARPPSDANECEGSRAAAHFTLRAAGDVSLHISLYTMSCVSNPAMNLYVRVKGPTIMSPPDLWRRRWRPLSVQLVIEEFLIRRASLRGLPLR
jgi:hypothetical protein